MKNTWVAIIGVLAITLCAGSSFATAPVAQDIPDFRLLTDPMDPNGTVNDFDLKDYVTDYDDAPVDLTYAIQGQVGFETADPVTLDPTTENGFADIAGKSAPEQGVVTYRISDASEYSDDASVVKYSSLWLVGPSLTEDNNLVPPDAFKRTWIIQADQTITSPAIAGLLVGATEADLTVSIADLAGVWQAGDNATTATFDDLSAAITGGGELELVKNPAVAVDKLSGAYRVGIKAKATGGGLADANDNWDGMELLVSTSRFPVGPGGFASTAIGDWEHLQQFNDFEGIPTVALPVDQNAMRALTPADNPYWYAGINKFSAVAEIVATAPTGATTSWASSGQALHVALPGATSLVFIQSENFTDIQPGESITLQANVTTTGTSNANAPTIQLMLGNFHMPSNYQGLALQPGAPTGVAQVPVGGADGWRTLKTTFTADPVGAAVVIPETSPAETFNFYQKGYQAAIFVKGGGSGAVDVYIDNIRIYRDKNDIDKALGATAIAVLKDPTPAEAFDGTCESAGTLAGLGWQQFLTNANEGNFTVDVSGANNMFTHEGSNALDVYVALPGVPPRTPSWVSYCLAPIRFNAGGTSIGNGIFGVTMWYKTNAPDLASVPDVIVGAADQGFRNNCYFVGGYAGAPLQGEGWKKITMSSARFSAAKMYVYIVIKAAAGDVATRPYWVAPWNTLAGRPGHESDAHVYFDDIKFHQVNDDVRYFDRSVFPATD